MPAGGHLADIQRVKDIDSCIVSHRMMSTTGQMGYFGNGAQGETADVAMWSKLLRQ
jgi:hypothetical protein